ncbi:dihydropteroate synthase [Morganella morganii]|uniref:dihydropteroate synthase n=1 Tax=Morganella morganii TaxID=582 RepID=UPI001BDA8A8C|nr:dihydropteroate synthase [Morganella morganii]EKJ0151543.1 dihydropteroate synthase [Salmonella enterica subsp. enterica serovar Bareilly]HBY5838842.1 dihydropteroate synthase [Klebsiella pneumoniae]MBT0309184.1 dihydropteroate synthase [Morganella morganii subsp. morganii]MBT0315733.1 dihydropteroate synthase [Morganella morganii subsp. morganii]MBT0368919.1 dihydropteroate synthase [Morganella morganii subsp. morganii]
MKLTARGQTLSLSTPQVMGILNVTPDSFSDGGTHNTPAKALEHARKMIAEGATIIDIGGESTRPGAAEVSPEQEAERVIPVVAAIARESDVWISVDTSKALVIREAANAGAHILNDIRSFSEPGALQAAAQSGLPVCVMHMQGEPRTMQQAPHYQNVVREVYTYLEAQVARCVAAGIEKNHIILDPGFGFGKTLTHNYQLLDKLDLFHNLGLPVLAGMSRKSMIGQLMDIPPDERVAGSVACAVIAAMKGAQIIRVHDVKETVQAMKVVEATRLAKETNDNE